MLNDYWVSGVEDKMPTQKLLRLIVLLGFAFTPGCVKYHKLLKKEFPQGKEKEKKEDVIVRNVRSTPVYDQFTTKAMFDVLWMSDEAREYYVDIYSQKHGYGELAADSMLRRQLEENRHYISFFVLAYLPENCHQVLNDKDSTWSFYLKTFQGEKITPLSIKEVELAPEIKYFFGNKISRFKSAYLIRFSKKGVLAKISQNAKVPEVPFKLIISSVDRDVHIRWGEKPSVGVKVNKWKAPVSTSNGKYVENEDFYWI